MCVHMMDTTYYYIIWRIWGWNLYTDIHILLWFIDVQNKLYRCADSATQTRCQTALWNKLENMYPSWAHFILSLEMDMLLPEVFGLGQHPESKHVCSRSKAPDSIKPEECVGDCNLISLKDSRWFNSERIPWPKGANAGHYFASLWPSPDPQREELTSWILLLWIETRVRNFHAKCEVAWPKGTRSDCDVVFGRYSKCIQ